MGLRSSCGAKWCACVVVARGPTRCVAALMVAVTFLSRSVCMGVRARVRRMLRRASVATEDGEDEEDEDEKTNGDDDFGCGGPQPLRGVLCMGGAGKGKGVLFSVDQVCAFVRRRQARRWVCCLGGAPGRGQCVTMRGHGVVNGHGVWPGPCG
jgi:hypothetical protein